MNGSEAGGDLVLIQTSLHLSCKYTYLALEQLHLHNKSSEVCIKTRSPLASLQLRDQVTEQTTVKWSISLKSYPFINNILRRVALGTEWDARDHFRPHSPIRFS